MVGRCDCGEDGFFYIFDYGSFENKKFLWKCTRCISDYYPVKMSGDRPIGARCTLDVSKKVSFSELLNFFEKAVRVTYFNEQKRVIWSPKLIAVARSYHYLADGGDHDGRCQVCNYVEACVNNKCGVGSFTGYCWVRDPDHVHLLHSDGPIREEPQREDPPQVCEGCGKKPVGGGYYCPECGKEFSIHTETEEGKIFERVACPYCKDVIGKIDVFCRSCGEKIRQG